MSRLGVSTAIVGILTVMPRIECAAQAEHIYLVKASHCIYPARSQTGFRLSGTKGIVTALHGVVDCDSIKAQDSTGRVAWKGLHLVQADVGRDAALLLSDELAMEEPVGIEVSSKSSWQAFEPVRVDGSPYGLSLIRTQLLVRPPPFRPLISLVPDNLRYKRLRDQLTQRNSPSPKTNVLNLQGPMLPGHSGAPILTSDEHVVALGSGGLEEGSTDVVWGIPLNGIQWQALDKAKIEKLKQLRVQELFALDVDPYPFLPAAAAQYDTGEESIGLGHHMTTSITIDQYGGLTGRTKIQNSAMIEGFCGRVAVVLFDNMTDTLVTVSWDKPRCVGGVLRGRMGLGIPSELLVQWRRSISADSLQQAKSLVILHSLGELDPLELLKTDVRRIRATTRVLPH